MVEGCPIAAQAARYPDKIAVISSDSSLNYSQFDQAIADFSKQLSHESSDILCVQANANLETLLYLWAGLRLNKQIYLYNPSLKTKDLDHLPKIDFSQHKDIPSSGFDAPATILATSGSSGEPKYVLHSLANHYAAYQNLNMPFSHKDTWACVLPLHHISGLSIVMRCAFAAASLVLAKDYKEMWWYDIPCNYVSMVGAQLPYYLENAHPDKPSIVLGGSPIAQPLLDAAAKEQHLYLSYGSTETAAQICSKTYDGQSLSVGKSKLDCKLSTQGELLLKGPQCFMGYLDKKGCVHTARDAEGYYHTGDRVAINEVGELMIEGRLDNMFISGGENVFPETIEKAFMDQFDLTSAYCIPFNDAKFGQCASLFIETEKEIPVSELVNFAKEYLLPHQRPRQYYRLPKLTIPIKKYRKYLKSYTPTSAESL